MSTNEVEIPETPGERLEKFKNSLKTIPHPDDPIWNDPEVNKKAAKELLWSAPHDARYPQVKRGNKCFQYYVDFWRCKELMGEDYKPCKIFGNVYETFCPREWVEKWDTWREEGRFPARFDR